MSEAGIYLVDFENVCYIPEVGQISQIEAYQQEHVSYVDALARV